MENFCKAWTGGQSFKPLAYCEKNIDNKTCAGFFKPSRFGGWEQLFIPKDEAIGSPTNEVMLQLIVVALILVLTVMKLNDV